MRIKIDWLKQAKQLWQQPADPLHDTEKRTKKTPVPGRHLSVSILTFASFVRCQQLLDNICPLMNEMSDLSVTITVRNNNPHLDSTEFDTFWLATRQQYSRLNFKLFNDGFNVGFGNGHNLNFTSTPSDYLLILNDDVGFPNIDWLNPALAILDNNPKIACVGANENPSSVTSVFGNGVVGQQGAHWPLRYVEGSVLLFRSSTFQEIGMLDPAFEWAMFEDADLSFRAQALGFELAWIDIPHEHWRSSSFNVLPTEAKSSILEHNRSVFFSKWNTAVAENHIGRYDVFDVWSDGIGDVFCALLHLHAYVETLTAAQRSLVVINTSQAALAIALFRDLVIIESVSDTDRLRAKYAASGFKSLKTLRKVNYGLPFNIHVLVCAALGIPVAPQSALGAAVEKTFVTHKVFPPELRPGGPFCVLHLESERVGHDGRTPSALMIRAIASAAADNFDRVVLVGRNRLLSKEDLSGHRATVVDLQGMLETDSLIALVASADAFVGIDSFPAHIAQVAGVRSSVFFGSVHPSFRVLCEAQTWPIVKPLDCIGCYHTALEPSIPFCLRRDLSCTKDIDASAISAAVQGCSRLEAFDWRGLSAQALELQRKFLLLLLFHPAPERQFVSGGAVKNELASNLIYSIIGQVQKIIADGNTQSVAKMARDYEALRSESFRKDMQVESMVKLIAELRR